MNFCDHTTEEWIEFVTGNIYRATSMPMYMDRPEYRGLVLMYVADTEGEHFMLNLRDGSHLVCTYDGVFKDDWEFEDVTDRVCLDVTRL